MMSAIEMSILQLERELEQLRGEIRLLAGLRLPGLEQSMASSQILQKPQPLISIATSQSTIGHGDSVTFTATLLFPKDLSKYQDPSKLAAPTGTVSFLDGETDLTPWPVPGPVPLPVPSTSGNPPVMPDLGLTASFTTTTLASGDRSITARYNGDGTYAGVRSDPIIEHVLDGVDFGTCHAVPSTLYAHCYLNPPTLTQTFTLTYNPQSGFYENCTVWNVTAMDGQTQCGRVARPSSWFTKLSLQSLSVFKVYWRSATGAVSCPVSSTCSTTPNVSVNFDVAGPNTCGPPIWLKFWLTTGSSSVPLGFVGMGSQNGYVVIQPT